MRVTIRFRRQPWVEKSRVWVFLLAMFIMACSGYYPTFAQHTTDCEHNSAKIGYWKNLRLIIGNLTAVEGNQFTLTTKDKNEVLTQEFTTNEETDLVSLDSDKKVHMQQVMLQKPKGIWVIAYCAHCHLAFQMKRVSP